MKKLILFGLIVSVVLISGCVQEPTSETDIMMIHAAVIEFKATTISLEGMGEDNNTAIVRIDDIISVDNPDDIDISDIYEGAEFNAYFFYSFVPAKIRTFTEEVDGDVVSMRMASRDPIGYEHPYLIYEKGSGVVEEITLPGLNEGDQFETTIFYIEPTSDYHKITINEYGVI